MKKKKEIFRVFKNAPAAEELALWLKDRGIESEVQDTSGYFDPSFASSILNREWTVRLAPDDFTKAGALLHAFYSERLDSIPSDYYLFSFSNDELEEIISLPDEWGDLDYALATHLLRERGKEVTDADLNTRRHKRYQALKEPETHEANGFIGWGYGLSFFGGFIGSLIGWYLCNSQKILPDGQSVPRYDAKSRAHGKRIVWIGAIVTAIFVLARMYMQYEVGIGAYVH